MKTVLVITALLALLPSASPAQNPPIPPFYQVYGGLFYPSLEDFGGTFNSPSDFVWGMGMGLPVSPDFLYLVVDLSWFRAKALTPGTPDVNSELSQKFIHAGLLNKYYLSTTLAFRFQGGVNYNSIERKVTPAGGTEARTGLPRKIGFYGGIGVENMLAGGKMSLFADAVYDYRRSVEREMYGDFGGVRLVVGMAAYWF
jgi:hypothetical protein